MSEKGGRPKKIKISSTRISFTENEETDECKYKDDHFQGAFIQLFFIFIVDAISYEANVKKMFEVFRNSGSQLSLKQLWKVTFVGRRRQITKAGEFDSIENVLQNCCPLLNQPFFVSNILIMFVRIRNKL